MNLWVQLLACMLAAAPAANRLPASALAAAGEEAVWRDPFSPIGYRSAVERLAAAPAAPAAPGQRPPLPPDLKTRALAQLRIGGIIRRGPVYVATVNGLLVKAGDELRVTLDGQTVAFVVRAITLKRVEIEPKD